MDDEGKTPLFLLLEKGGANPAIVRKLLHAGSSPNKVTWQLQQTALHLAAKKGYQVCIKDLMVAGARVDKTDSAGNTALMYAARDGHDTVIRTLVKEGANPNHRNLAKESAMHLASRAGHEGAVFELLEAGASPNFRDNRGQTPFLLASKRPHIPVVEILLDYHCEVNSQDTQTGKTPLHFAVQHGITRMVEAILEEGAEPNIRDKNWQTPFMMALSMSRRDIMEVLLRARCNIAVTDKSFNTALHIAARDGQTDLITLLIDAGIDVNIKGAGGLTPLMWAAYEGYVSIVGLLLKYGANPDLMDRNRATALMYATLSSAPDTSCREIVKVLIRANSKLDQSANLQNILQTLDLNLGKDATIHERLYSPLEVAFLKGRTVIFMMLLRAGCDVNDFQCSCAKSANHVSPMSVNTRNQRYLLSCMKKERHRVKELKEACRKPVLEFLKRIPGSAIQHQISKLPISDQLKGFLNYSDLEDVEGQFNVIMREARQRTTSGTNVRKSKDVSAIYHAPSRAKTPSPTRNVRLSRSDQKRKSLPPSSFYNDKIRNGNDGRAGSTGFGSSQKLSPQKSKERKQSPGVYQNGMLKGTQTTRHPSLGRSSPSTRTGSRSYSARDLSYASPKETKKTFFSSQSTGSGYNWDSQRRSPGPARCRTPSSQESTPRMARNDPKRRSLPMGYYSLRYKNDIENGSTSKFSSAGRNKTCSSPTKSIGRQNSYNTDASPSSTSVTSEEDLCVFLSSSSISGSLDRSAYNSSRETLSPKSPHRRGVHFSLSNIAEHELDDIQETRKRRLIFSRSQSVEK